VYIPICFAVSLSLSISLCVCVYIHTYTYICICIYVGKCIYFFIYRHTPCATTARRARTPCACLACPPRELATLRGLLCRACSELLTLPEGAYINYIYIRIYVCANIHVSLSVYFSISISISICVHVWVYVICIYIYMYMHIYISICIYSYIYTHTMRNDCSSRSHAFCVLSLPSARASDAPGSPVQGVLRIVDLAGRCVYNV